MDAAAQVGQSVIFSTETSGRLQAAGVNTCPLLLPLHPLILEKEARKKKKKPIAGKKTKQKHYP